MISQREHSSSDTYTNENRVRDTKHRRALREVDGDGCEEALERFPIRHAGRALGVESACVEYLAKLFCRVFARRLVAMVDEDGDTNVCRPR